MAETPIPYEPPTIARRESVVAIMMPAPAQSDGNDTGADGLP